MMRVATSSISFLCSAPSMSFSLRANAVPVRAEAKRADQFDGDLGANVERRFRVDQRHQAVLAHLDMQMILVAEMLDPADAADGAAIGAGQPDVFRARAERDGAGRDRYS